MSDRETSASTDRTPSPAARRPRVICHMAASVDGRIVVGGWPGQAAAAVRREYERVHASYEADGWICGRVSMEPFAGRARSGVEVAREHEGGAPRDDFIAPVADGRVGTPALFDEDAGAATPRRLSLRDVERRADDVLWLRYRVE